MNRAVEAVLEAGAFAWQGSAAAGPMRIGVEVEFLPRRRGSAEWIPVGGPDGSVELFARSLAPARWQRFRLPTGAPAFRSVRGGMLSFEPGGQLEYSSTPHLSLRELRREVAEGLDAAAAAYAVIDAELVGCGMDPLWSAEDVPLQLGSPRYVTMAGYLARRSGSGAAMMRLSAGIHLNVDAGTGETALLRWTLANRLVPVLIALFANAPSAAGVRSPWNSDRARVWRELDPDRTDFFWEERDPVAEYARFARGAAYLPGEVNGRFSRLEEVLDRIGPQEIATHLTTLFPEVRPKRYLEIRCVDALPREWWAVPAIVVAALLRDEAVARACLDLLPAPSAGLVREAGVRGLGSPTLGERARAVYSLALEAARTDRSGMLGNEEILLAEAFYRRFTGRGMAPGDMVAGRHRLSPTELTG